MSNIINDPGKFEGEHKIVSDLWNSALEGGSDTEEYDGETPVSFFVFTTEDRAKYPELTEYGIALWESEQGFVNSRYFDTQAQYDAMIEELSTAEEEETEE